MNRAMRESARQKYTLFTNWLVTLAVILLATVASPKAQAQLLHGWHRQRDGQRSERRGSEQRDRRHHKLRTRKSSRALRQMVPEHSLR